MNSAHHRTPDLSGARWRTSTYSGGNNECVEVAHNLPLLVPVRDSKRPTGPVITFGHDAWHAFVSELV
ncbi:DUF397 domain-containing protein [Streptomyces brevispora]|uniref:DUF397 domain-containing protein n=1 Tax=Streptomyces brevispora TaxID=887462 RepID=A0A561V249_9ACTN|nr:DUF397 domain-containing protein [Streptomyces brevispora]TWG05691.1 uncharacterized protein DUF397 [Streptomyces brevispora]WSC13310.1 DUF397 domain-containing protein [Streptomyces brevispora]